jgi:hypothetical protein
MRSLVLVAKPGNRVCDEWRQPANTYRVLRGPIIIGLVVSSCLPHLGKSNSASR